MEPTAAFHQREEAAFLAEGGDLRAADEALSAVVTGLAPAGTVGSLLGHRLDQLCGALIDRASLRRYASRWEDALADLARAEDLLASALPALRSAHLPGLFRLRAKIHLNPATAAFDLSRAETALASLRALGAMGWVADDLELDLASFSGDWARALAAAIRVREAVGVEGWVSGVAFARTKLGRAYLELGRLTDAARELAAAYTHLKRHGPTEVKGDVALLLGRVRLEQGAVDEAWTFASEALEAHESITGHSRVLDDRQRFWSDELDVHRTAFDIALAAAGPAGVLRAWSVAERAKAFSLRQMARSADTPLFEGIDPALLARLRVLEDRLDALDRRAHEQPVSDGGVARTALHAERQAALAAIIRGNPRWGALNEPAPFEVEDCLAELRARGWVPVSYFFREMPEGGAQMHLLSRDIRGVPIHVVEPWSAEELKELRAARARPAPSSRLAGKLLPEAFRAALPPLASLLISPHAGAHLLPLHALGDEGTRLGEAHDVQYIPTLALLAHARWASGPRLALGACGVGRHAGGDAPEDWLGPYLPLFYAGARAVLVSLSAADSQPARHLMTALHQRVAAGEPPARALRTVLDTMKEQPDAHPADWYLVGIP